MIRTKKQKVIMGLIMAEAGQGRLHNIRELHELLPYRCHYGSFRRSLEFLEEKGMIVKEPAGNSTVIHPTELGYTHFRPEI